MSVNGLAMSLRGVEKPYPGFALGPLDLALEPGTVVGLVGPNGAGKTSIDEIAVEILKGGHHVETR